MKIKYILNKFVKLCKNLDGFCMELLYPPRCPVCDEVAAEGFPICPGCRKRIREVKEPVCKNAASR